MKKCPQLTQRHKDERLHWVRLLRMNSSDYQDVLGHRLVPHVQRFPGVINRNGSCTDY
uniref:Uncharacterized protein n=1 Tax=Heterorhabditis bacteriophora TaxID=37862 RepID=A0A1I7X6H4_HETBA